jgi:cell shape-determining protein MreC
MDHVPQGDPISPGDRLITSGLGRTVPRGLPVGVVRKVTPSQVELFQRIEVETHVKFSALSRVYVITREGPWYSRRGDSVPPGDLTPDQEGSQP